MAGGLLTDLYELNMAASYLRRGMTGPATFSLFVRQLPADRGFLVAAGLEDGLRFLEEFSFTGGDLDYLRREQGYGEDALRAFEGLRFTGEVWAVPEGRVVFAGEPLLEVTAPIAEAQLAETVLLNHVTFQTSVATKAARCGECQIFCARGFSLSGSGCLSVTVFSRYLMLCCPVYPALPRNRTFRAVPGLMLRVPVFPASCAVAGACCLILRGSHGGPFPSAIKYSRR